MNTIRFLYPYLRAHWKGYFWGLLLVPISTATALSIPYFTGEAVKVLEGTSRAEGALATLIAAILVGSVIRGIALFAVRFLIIGASRKMEFDLRNDLFGHLQNLDQLFFKNARTGDLMARITSDVENARMVAGPVIMYTANTFFMLAVAVPLMVSLSWTLTICILIPLSLLTLAVRLIGPRVHEAIAASQETLSELSSVAQENFAGARVVKSFAQEENEGRRFETVGRKFLGKNIEVARVSSWMHPIVGGVGDLSLISLLLVGGALILWGDLDLSGIVKFSGYQALLLWPMIALGWVVNQFQRGETSVRRLQELFSAEPKVKEPAAPSLPPSGEIEGRISIRHLTFSFGGTPVLDDVSIEVPQGTTVAIVGRTGSGKSTLLSLIPRVYPVPDGTIFIDDIDVNRLPLALLRQSIGFVPQESFLFSRTVNENIAFGVEGLDVDDISSAARVTRLDKDIDQLPRGYHELVGERGVTLSGGQKQRAAMARALLVRPKILILDDALSAVDTSTEEEILENLKEATKELTTLIVSHRISSIRHADRIYVLDGGAVAEEGTHDELLLQDRLYAEMYRRQLISDELSQM